MQWKKNQYIQLYHQKKKCIFFSLEPLSSFHSTTTVTNTSDSKRIYCNAVWQFRYILPMIEWLLRFKYIILFIKNTGHHRMFFHYTYIRHCCDLFILIQPTSSASRTLNQEGLSYVSLIPLMPWNNKGHSGLGSSGQFRKQLYIWKKKKKQSHIKQNVLAKFGSMSLLYHVSLDMSYDFLLTSFRVLSSHFPNNFFSFSFRNLSNTLEYH